VVHNHGGSAYSKAGRSPISARLGSLCFGRVSCRTQGITGPWQRWSVCDHLLATGGAAKPSQVLGKPCVIDFGRPAGNIGVCLPALGTELSLYVYAEADRQANRVLNEDRDLQRQRG
jgi:hypothetical protein